MKKLKEILFKVNIDSVFGDTNINVSKITFDSREVKDQALFIAIKGHKAIGNKLSSKKIKEVNILSPKKEVVDDIHEKNQEVKIEHNNDNKGQISLEL